MSHDGRIAGLVKPKHETTAGRKAKIAVLGDGGWGTALALTLNANGHSVTVWGPFADYIAQIKTNRENTLYLPGVRLPEEIRWTADPAEAVSGAGTVVIAIPTRFFRSALIPFANLISKSAIIVSGSKGLDPDTCERMTQVAEQALQTGPVAALSGPSHAEEVAAKLPTAVVVACADVKRVQILQKTFMNSRFRVYTSDDVVGVELGGALKNVIAVAAGVSDGLGFGNNAKAALVTRGLTEMTRLGCALGARPSTFAGLSGMGDLVVTCTSKLSRNWAVGERMGRSEKIEDILRGMKQVAEGVWNCDQATRLARERNIAVPIMEQVYAIIRERRNPLEAVESLMTRDAKPEH